MFVGSSVACAALESVKIIQLMQREVQCAAAWRGSLGVPMVWNMSDVLGEPIDADL